MLGVGPTPYHRDQLRQRRILRCALRNAFPGAEEAASSDAAHDSTPWPLCFHMAAAPLLQSHIAISLDYARQTLHLELLAVYRAMGVDGIIWIGAVKPPDPFHRGMQW